MKSKIEKNMENAVKFYVYKAFKILGYIILGVCIAFLVGYIVMRLWNWLMPDLFGLPQIDYWKALGILLLSKIIFGFGGGGGDGRSKGKKSKNKNRVNACSKMRKDFSQWKHYDEFWQAEGEQSYKNYVDKLNTKKSSENPAS